MGLIRDACLEIDELYERCRVERDIKYARRYKMRYIDRLLNELELLNMAEQQVVPAELGVRVGRLIDESGVADELDGGFSQSVAEAMEILYNLQDSLMFNQIEEE